MSKLKEGLSKEEITHLNRLFWRSNSTGLCFSYARQNGIGLQWGMYDFIRWLYPHKEQKEERLAVLRRHGVFFNVTPYIVTAAMGLFASMEKRAAEDPDFDTSSINAVKVGIQGPLSGIGDSIFLVAWRVVVTGITLPMAMQGNPLGFILFLILFNIPQFILKYYLTFASYKMGSTIIEKAFDNGIIDLLIKGASILGLVMVGAMVATTVNVPFAVVLGAGADAVTLNDALNGIMPGLMSFLIALGTMKLLQKKISVIWITVGYFAVAILGALVGIF